MGGGQLCFSSVPDLPGLPSVARVPAPCSPREFPAWLLPTREASEASDGCHDRKCPPAQPTQTAPPFPAAPSPRARPAGPGSPDSRGRCNRLGRPISRPLSLALAARGPSTSADPKRIQKEREIPTASLGPPPCSGNRKASMHLPPTPRASDSQSCFPPRSRKKIPRHPLWAAVETQSPSGRCPATQ